MNLLSHAASDLRQHLAEPDIEQIMLKVSACWSCAEFLLSERTPSVGACLLHDVQVLAQDKACSQYYQEEEFCQKEEFEPISSDDEF